MVETAFADTLDRYFDAFQRKSLEQLEELVAPNITLRDWDTVAIGVENFLSANGVVFDSFDNIAITRVASDVIAPKAFCLLEIELDRSAPLTVLDVIVIDNKGKIVSIEAFRQF